MSDQEEFDVFGEQTEEEKKAQAELAAKNAEKKEGEKKPKCIFLYFFVHPFFVTYFL